MTTQPSMFDAQNALYGGTAPFEKSSDTSAAAARELAPSRADTLRRAIYDYLTRYGGCTDEELQAKLNMAGNTERPRRRELELLGLVLDSGARRSTRTGRKAVVWVIAQAQAA